MRALVALDRDDARGAFARAARASARRARGRSRSRSTPSSGPAARAMRRGQIEVEQEILAERFLGATGRGGGSPRAAAAGRRSALMPAGAGAAASSRRAAPRACSAAIRLDGSAVPVPAMSKAVPWSGEVRTKGRPSVTLTRVVEGERLDRDQRLVVIHAERRVVGRARRRVEHRVGRQRAARVDAVGAQRARPPARRSSRPPRRACRLRRHAD